MKKFFGFLLGAAAVTASVVYLTKRQKQETMLITQEFEDELPESEESPASDSAE